MWVGESQDDHSDTLLHKFTVSPVPCCRSQSTPMTRTLTTGCPSRERDVRSVPTAEDADSYCHGSTRMEQFVLPQCSNEHPLL
ncbi:hypothetical protein EYF80_001367 [Liparis tanakae]|uniref:Uncharacterized protein n=1 Tax=Liparis tanakae TaxID=230148 RepID=A0A4Z2JFJ1_9TELE|nr:hypothetical protein EYF80_001367 [Liparis tanakae]